MKGTRIIDRITRAPSRHSRVLECFEKAARTPSDFKDAKGAYYAIVQQSMVEKLSTPDIKEIFNIEDFEIIPSLECKSHNERVY